MKRSSLREPAYKIISALDQDYVLECNSQNKIILNKWHKAGNQMWKIIKAGDGKFCFQSLRHSTFLMAPKSESNKETQIEAGIFKKQANQYWELIPCTISQYKGRYVYFIRSYCGKVIDVSGGQAKNEQQIIEWDFHGNNNQVWIIESADFKPLQNVKYKIVSALNTSMVLDASQNPKDQNRALIWKWRTDDNQNQKFYIHIQNGKYALLNAKTGWSLQVANGHSDTNATIKVDKYNKQDHQLWEFVPCSLEKYKEKNAFFIRSNTGFVLDVMEESDKNGTFIIQWKYNGNKNQIWFIEAC